MSQVTFTYNPTPAPACYPADVNGLAQLLTDGGMLAGTIPDNSGGGVFVGVTPPTSANTTKVWFRTDGLGRPIGVYMFYSGNWRKIYTGVSIGMIVMSLYYSGLFDGTGKGIVGGDWDGWAMCNGSNGTPNLEGYTAVCGVPGESVGQPAGQFYTDADGVAWRNTGGQRARVVITTPNLPSLQTVGFFRGGQWASGSNGGNLAVIDGSAPQYRSAVVDTTTGFGGQSQPLPYQNLYVALGFLMFIGY